MMAKPTLFSAAWVFFALLPVLGHADDSGAAIREGDAPVAEALSSSGSTAMGEEQASMDAAAPQVRQEKKPPLAFTPGEELNYKISALGMTAGKAKIQVGTSTDLEGTQAWPVVVQARTDSIFDSIFSVRDKFVTWWEPGSGRVLGADLYADERGKKHRSRSRLDHAKGKAEVSRVKEWNGERSTRSYDIPEGAYDIAGAIFALRGRPLVPGTVEEVDVFTGKKVFRLRCIVEGKEKIRVGAGSYEAIVARIELGFEGNFASKRDVRAWFSADERKIPLRIEAELVLGSLVADLSSAKKGIRL